MIAGANPMLLKRGILAGTEALVKAIDEQSIEVTTNEEIANVAAISTQDWEIGELIVEVMDEVGKDSVITVEESKGLAFETEYVEGMQFDRGYISPYFVTSPGSMEAVIEEPYIVIHEKKISAATDIVPILEKLVQGGKRKRESATLQDLGRADNVVSTKDDTTIVGGRGDEKAIVGRIEEIQVEIERSARDYDKEKLQERLAKLSGGVAIIRVGAATEVELKEKKHRVGDALSVTFAAVEEGIVPGGGVALINAISAPDQVKLDYEDERIGVNILRKALEMPLRRIVGNAGRDGAVVLEHARRSHSENGKRDICYDVLKNQYVDMVEAGIIDPAKVIKGGLENAASIAAIILTTEALVSDIAEKKKAAAAIPPESYDDY